MTRNSIRTLLLVAASASVVGCATPRQVAQTVVDANLAQEEAHNELLLLNVVRAYLRRPMHFSKMAQARLPLGIGNPTFTVPTPFGPDFNAQVYNVQTQIAVQQSVDTVPLDTQEFFRGITTPVPPTLLTYYLDQGWPQQMILHMFVRTIEVYDTDGKLVERLENYPPNPNTFAVFQRALEGLMGCEIDVDPRRLGIGPVYSDARMGDARAVATGLSLALLPADDKGNALPDGSPLHPDETRRRWRFFADAKPGLKTSEPGSREVNGSPCALPNGAEALSAEVDNKLRRPQGGKRTAVMLLRSPEAMLYYLGEVARAAHGHSPTRFKYRRPRADACGTGDALLFGLTEGADPEAVISVDYEHRTFAVRQGSCDDRSLHVLSLMTQILGLQNKASDLPTTANVRVVAP